MQLQIYNGLKQFLNLNSSHYKKAYESEYSFRKNFNSLWITIAIAGSLIFIFACGPFEIISEAEFFSNKDIRIWILLQNKFEPIVNYNCNRKQSHLDLSPTDKGMSRLLIFILFIFLDFFDRKQRFQVFSSSHFLGEHQLSITN